ncbi:MAG: thioredoxin family protein [Hyphomicrobium sp.]
MLKFLRFALVLALCSTALVSAPRAAHDLDTSSVAISQYELVVLEVENCIYCQIFRRDVLPGYELSARAKSVPIRFVDLNQPEADTLGLDSPVDLVPTVVLLNKRKEVGRIAGYVGPEAFFHAVNRLMSGSGADFDIELPSE